jgi:hypothetical protein
VKASLLMALVVVLAHLSTQRLLPLVKQDRDSVPGREVLVEIGPSATHMQANSKAAGYCSTACDSKPKSMLS